MLVVTQNHTLTTWGSGMQYIIHEYIAGRAFARLSLNKYALRQSHGRLARLSSLHVIKSVVSPKSFHFIGASCFPFLFSQHYFMCSGSVLVLTVIFHCNQHKYVIISPICQCKIHVDPFLLYNTELYKKPQLHWRLIFLTFRLQRRW